MTHSNSTIRALRIGRIAVASLSVAAITAFTSPANAAWFDPASGLWIGNVCQTPVGWQVVPPAPVGSSCYSAAFGAGVIAR